MDVFVAVGVLVTVSIRGCTRGGDCTCVNGEILVVSVRVAMGVSIQVWSLGSYLV